MLYERNTRPPARTRSFNMWRSSTDPSDQRLWRSLPGARWIRARRRMRLTPERIAKARVPAPETKRHSARNQGRRKRAGTHEDPHEDSCSRHSHMSWTSTAGSPRSRQTILRASRRRSSLLARTIRLSKDARVYRRRGGPGRGVGVPRSSAPVVVMDEVCSKRWGFTYTAIVPHASRITDLGR